MKCKKCSHEGCNNPSFSKNLCLYHYKLKFPEKYQIKQKKKFGYSGNKIKPVSDKQKERLETYFRMRDEYMENHIFCERCGSPNNLTLHHLRGRGKYLLEYFCCLCFDCHRWVHDFPLQAELEGFLIKRIKK